MWHQLSDYWAAFVPIFLGAVAYLWKLLKRGKEPSDTSTAAPKASSLLSRVFAFRTSLLERESYRAMGEYDKAVGELWKTRALACLEDLGKADQEVARLKGLPPSGDASSDGSMPNS